VLAVVKVSFSLEMQVSFIGEARWEVCSSDAGITERSIPQ
jgi:hypothetical protein